MQENNCLKLSHKSYKHWCWNYEQHLNLDLNFDHQMLVFKQLFSFYKHVVPLAKYKRVQHEKDFKAKYCNKFQPTVIPLNFWDSYIFIVIIPYHSCITKPLFAIVIRASGFKINKLKLIFNYCFVNTVSARMEMIKKQT
jgi:hypothetical protein